MKGTCSGCRAPVEWRFNLAGKPEPYNPDGSSHFGSCPFAYQFMPPTPSDPYEAPGEAEKNVWDELSRQDILALQLEESRRSIRESGAMACREQRRDAEHGDKFCRMCFQPRPIDHRCKVGSFRPVIRYARIGGEVRPLKDQELRDYVRDQQQKGATGEQAFI